VTAPSPIAASPIGGTFHGRYEIIRCLKVGGMGAVYEVLDQKTRQRRALKVMLPSCVADPELRARFRQEATITADIESDHIVETYDAGSRAWATATTGASPASATTRRSGRG
jgi:eukaryotic-like serine/threonine-protein kinase